MRLDLRLRRLERPARPNPCVADLDAYLHHLSEVFQRMDRNPPASFASSFLGEFESLQRVDRDAVRNMHVEFESSINPTNALKNRYPNILSNECSRFKLASADHDDTDYINANCVSGISARPGYIATQAPLPDTMAQFWQMVYEENCPVIVILTREQEAAGYYPRCHRYWPPSNEPEPTLYGRYYVLAESESADEALGIIVRKFRVGKTAPRPLPLASAESWHDSDPSVPPEPPANDVVLEPEGEPLLVTQIQYVDWPDQGVPETPRTLLAMCKMVDDLCAPDTDSAEAPAAVATVKKPPGRPIIHCSAGVGRTGTFIAVHKLLSAVYDAFPITGERSTKVPTPHQIVTELKQQRSKMVQTAEQYRFIFIALMEGVLQYRGRVIALDDPQ